ncbi:hypothetical protein FJZ36_19220, partial [Candidatus Poribacteria bacterium]|nr:hypothetical protein [Candidatus Poribacteria bacterium]
MSAGKRLRNGVVLGIAWAVGGIVRRLPEATALRVGSALGGLLYRALGSRRRVAEVNLVRAFPARSAAERAALAREHFDHLGRSVVELLRFPLWTASTEARIAVEGRDRFSEVARTGAGIVVFVAHTGNWEILAPLWHSLHPSPMVLAHPMDSPALDRLVTRCRQVTGLEIVPRQGGLRRLVAGLKQGRVVGLLADQDAGASGVFVPFFGELASAEPSPVTLARRLGCPLWLCLPFREPDGSHRV